ncbi:hypothetical protein ONR57_06445 [Hoyosella sp. YIM 151337]|uniref:hypothetical protein n=1 Tax=Hoyosella sp. YIM 151337 TaxID=2992742 RepID=UPI00223544FA|nr:hypothetical protein [Hoyosella sp. YIM 151337]MCW4352932.1 hypothetical protein [Hoyosella sp. YIM 151337]
MNTLAGTFLIVHGLVHWSVWISPGQPHARRTDDPRFSWLARRWGIEAKASFVAVGLAGLSALTFVGAGLGLLLGSSWAPFLAVIGALTSLVLCVGFYHTWLAFGVVVNPVIMASIVATHL